MCALTGAPNRKAPLLDAAGLKKTKGPLFVISLLWIFP